MPPKAKKCPDNGINGKILKQKVKRRRKGQKVFECKFCFKKFDHITGVKNHKAICKDLLKKEEKKFVCQECKKIFKFKDRYDNHLLLEHSQTPGSVACDQCLVKCPNQETLNFHIENYHNRDEHQCPYCNRKFARSAHVLRHLSQRGCDGRQLTGFPCEICNTTFTRKDNLIVHLRLQHIEKKLYECKLCAFHSSKFHKLVIHYRNFHLDNPNHFECDTCGKVTGSRGAMAKHLETHGEKKFICECGYSTFTMEVMRRHVFTHTERKPYNCDQCGKSYIQRSQLMRHLSVHIERTCSICNMQLSCKASLYVHEKKHSNELLELVCSIPGCTSKNKIFDSENELINHIKEHLEPKPYECHICKKKYRSELLMQKHVDTHSLERPRRCMYCVSARAYIRGGQLVKHVRTRHPALFKQHLETVRRVMGGDGAVYHNRVTKSELESVLNVLDAESEHIIDGYGPGVLYGGMQEVQIDYSKKKEEKEGLPSPLMSEEELAKSLNKLLIQLIDEETLKLLGWPEESIDVVLEMLLEKCGAHAAERARYSRVQRLRENAKQLFLHVVEDKALGDMLHTHTIDQLIAHVLAKVAEDADA